MTKIVKIKFECFTEDEAHAYEITKALTAIDAPGSSINMVPVENIRTEAIAMTPENIKVFCKRMGWTYEILAHRLSTPHIKITKAEVDGWMAGTRNLSKMGKSAMYQLFREYIPELQ